MDPGPTLRERLSALTRREIVGLAGVAVVALAGVGLWYARSLPRPVEVRVDPRDDGAPAPGVTPAQPNGGPPLVVHVAGWVRNPGVYQLEQGDRVIDAIEAAGGPRHGAFLDGLNLAAPLADGQQVLVPRRGAGGGPAPPPSGAPGSGSGALVNVNTASPDELETLPGIGEVLAQRIVDHRVERGPFATVDDLLDVSGIGEATLEEIRDLVTV